jgi:hypothetical protein
MSTREGEIARRTRRYWYEDGLVEIGSGVVFAAVGLLFAIDGLAATGALPPFFRAVALTLTVVLVLLAPLAIRAAINATKERLTSPRTGYVGHLRPSRQGRVLRVAAAILVGVIVTGVVVAPSGTANRLAAIPSLAVAAVLLVPAWRLRLRRFYLLAVVALSAGAAGVVLALGQDGQSALVYLGPGVALILSGALTLRSYLRQTRVAADPGR